jgi:predicted nucleic acid-binding protein
MNGNRYLADTNAFIYLLRKHPAILPLIDSEWSYSFITRIELLGKPAITPSEIELVKALLDACHIIPHTESIDNLTIKLK